MPRSKRPYVDDGKPLFYGRRKGKTIKTDRKASYELIMPWAQIALPAAADTDPKTLFDFPVTAVWLEVGFGNGEQLAHQALANPTIGMIGCEPFMNGVAALCREIRDKNIKNIRIWQDDARLLMPLLKSKSIARCFVLNSDPWPKTKHHKRRFIQKETLDEIHRLMPTGAELRLSSDDPRLNSWQMEKPYFHPGYEWLANEAADWRTRPADMLGTRYQEKGAEAGRATMFMNFRTR